MEVFLDAFFFAPILFSQYQNISGCDTVVVVVVYGVT